jgi:hypothetical protein
LAVQALANERSPIPAQYLGFIDLFGAFGQLDVFGTLLFGNLAKFECDTVRINKLSGKAGTRPQSNNQQHIRSLPATPAEPRLRPAEEIANPKDIVFKGPFMGRGMADFTRLHSRQRRRDQAERQQANGAHKP